MNIITTDRNGLPTQEGFVIDEFLLRGGETLQSLDIDMYLVLLRLDFAEKVYKLGIYSDSILLKDLFSDNDDISWSSLESSWANILRNTQKNIVYILEQREKLLRKESKLITPEDEKEYDDLGEEMIQEIQEAKRCIEETTHNALGLVFVPPASI